MSKFLMIELMLLYGSISLERAEELIKTHIDDVESEWLQSFDLEGSFDCGSLA
jgi:hypothetical protein